jgi:hypothetical protein
MYVNEIVKYLPLNNRQVFGRLFFDYTSLFFIAIVKTITKNNAPSTQKIPALKNNDYLMLGTYSSRIPIHYFLGVSVFFVSLND